MTDPMDPPKASAPAARRRPGLVAMLYGYRAIVGMLLALPAAAVLSAFAGSYPRGGRELFDAGGVLLLEAVRLTRHAAPAIVYGAGALTIVATLLGLFPLGMLIAGLGREGRLSAAFLVGRAWAGAGTLALIYGVSLAAQVVAFFVLSLLGGQIADWLELGDPAGDLWLVGVFAFILVIVAAIGVVRDLAYVAAVHGGHRFYVAVSRALRCGVRSPVRAAFARAWRASLGLAAVVFAAWAAPSLRGTTGGAVVVAGIALHQASLLAAAFARASWLAAAIRLFGTSERA